MTTNLSLPPREARAWRALRDAAPEPVSRRDLAHAIWGGPVARRQLDAVICRLRARTERPIHTVRGQGYALGHPPPAEGRRPDRVLLPGAVVDLQHHRVRSGDRESALTPAEAHLLAALAAAGEAPVPRSHLARVALGRRDGDTRSVDALVCRLRRKLGRSASALRTIHGRGYALTAVLPLPASHAPPAPTALPRGRERSLLEAAAAFAAGATRDELAAVVGSIDDRDWASLAASPWVSLEQGRVRVRDRERVRRTTDPPLRARLERQREGWLRARLHVPEEIRTVAQADLLRRLRDDAREVGATTADDALRARCLVAEGALLVLEGAFVEAWRVLGAALGEPDAPQAPLRLHAARVALELGRLDEAEALLAPVPGPEARFTRCVLALHRGDRSSAASGLRALLDDPTVGPRAEGTLALLAPTHADAEAGYRRALERLSRSDDVRSWGRTSGNLAHLLHNTGRADEAEAPNAFACEIAALIGDLRLLTIHRGEEAALLLQRGPSPTAVERFARNAAFYRASGSTHRAALAHGNQALALADLGRLREAAITAELATALATGTSPQATTARWAAALVELVHRGWSPALQERVAALGPPTLGFEPLARAVAALARGEAAEAPAGDGVLARLLRRALAAAR